MPTWSAGQYLRFAEERTRPCHDLASRVAIENPRRILDLGCGPGNSTAVLAARWPGAEIAGLDNSADMIETASATYPAHRWIARDIAEWAGNETEQYDLVFSNAALQWAPEHAIVYPRLLERVAPGGALAVQVPGNLNAPSHTLMRELAMSPVWHEYFPDGRVREWHVHDLAFYYDTLSRQASRLDLWETEYIHVMHGAEAIVEWYRGTGMRPFLDVLPTDELRARFAADYLEAIRPAYPLRPGGRVLFPFRRLFVIAYR